MCRPNVVMQMLLFYMTLANVQSLDCFTCVPFKRKSVLQLFSRVQISKSNVKPNSLFQNAYIQINYIKAALRYAGMPLTHSLFRQRLSSKFGVMLLP